MRYVTTIHLDCTSTTDDYIRAAIRVFEETGDPVGNKNEWIAKLVTQMRLMVANLTGPFEIRVGSNANEPVVVVHPSTREAGALARRKAVERGDWVTSVLEPKPVSVPGYGKSARH